MAGYAGNVALPLRINGAEHPHEVSGSPRLQGALTLYLCRDLCIPVSLSLAAPLASVLAPSQVVDNQATGLVEAAFGRLPVVVKAGDPEGLRITRVARGAEDKRLVVDAISQEATPFVAPDVFVEATPDSSGGGIQARAAPPQITLLSDGRTLRAEVSLLEPVGREVVVTLVDGHQAIEARVPVTWLSSPLAAQDLWLASYWVLLALIGGLLLNLTPCGLPILALKLSAGPRARFEAGSVALAILAVFAGMAVILVGVQALTVGAFGGAHPAIFWGTQFQQPLFLATLLVLLSLFIAVALGWLVIPGARFLPGTLSGLLASACLAPYTGAALSFSLGAPLWLAASVTVAIGAGLALPYGLVAVWPGAAQRLVPSSGAWTRWVTGAFFTLLLALIGWIGWVYSGVATAWQTALTVAAVVGLLLVWRFTQTQDGGTRGGRRWLVVMLVVAIFGLASLDLETARDGAPSFDLQQIDQALAQGQTALVVVGARWCLTCVWNETVLQGQQVQESLRGVAYIYGDWTTPDPVIEAFLLAHGQAGLPFTAVFYPEGTVAVLPPILTTQEVVAALAPTRPDTQQPQGRSS